MQKSLLPEFELTETIVEPCYKNETIDALIERFKKKAAARAIEVVFVDDSVRSWFAGTSRSSSGAGPGRLLRFAGDMHHPVIKSGCDRSGSYSEYDGWDAFSRIVSLLGEGHLDAKGSGILVYLDKKMYGLPCRMFAWRDNDGHLCVDAATIDMDREYLAGECILVDEARLTA
ncbi:MAG: hypothetical protein JWM20_627 [Patescibacteria group bacterium]|nr:hypothetical protein [Patescibacteria group bacterium]